MDPLCSPTLLSTSCDPSYCDDSHPPPRSRARRRGQLTTTSTPSVAGLDFVVTRQGRELSEQEYLN